MVVFDCHDDDVRCHMITIMLSINGKIGSCQITWISYDHVDDDGEDDDGKNDDREDDDGDGNDDDGDDSDDDNDDDDGEDDDSKIVADGQIASGSKIVIANSKW